jgi:hypothetical protein
MQLGLEAGLVLSVGSLGQTFAELRDLFRTGAAATDFGTAARG